MGEKAQDQLKLQFNKRLRLEFHRARITSDSGLLAYREVEGALGLMEAAVGFWQTKEQRQKVICKVEVIEEYNAPSGVMDNIQAALAQLSQRQGAGAVLYKDQV